MRHAGRDERLCCPALSALLCRRRRRRWVAALLQRCGADAADSVRMGLPGDSRGIRVLRNTSQCACRDALRLAARSGALASDMCKKKRVVVAT